MALLSLTLQHARPYRVWIALVFVFQLVSTIAALYLPSLNARIIDEGVSKGDTDFIWSTGMVMLVVCVVQVVTGIIGIYFGARTAMAIGRDLRRDVYRKVDSLGALELSQFGTATLITRGTNDVQQVQMLVLMTLNFMVTTPIMSIGGIIMALREDAGLSWLVWVSVPLLFVVVGFLVRLLLPLFRIMQERIDGINGVLREQILGIRVVRAFVREPFEARRYATANDALTARERQGRQPVRADVPRDHDDPAPGHRGGAVVRRAQGRRGRDPGRVAHCLPPVPSADPDRRDDGRFHGDDDPARGGERRADQ